MPRVLKLSNNEIVTVLMHEILNITSTSIWVMKLFSSFEN